MRRHHQGGRPLSKDLIDKADPNGDAMIVWTAAPRARTSPALRRARPSGGERKPLPHHRHAHAGRQTTHFPNKVRLPVRERRHAAINGRRGLGSLGRPANPRVCVRLRLGQPTEALVDVGGLELQRQRSQGRRPTAMHQARQIPTPTP